MKALVIGHGSAGSRHARVLAGLGAEVAVLSRRRLDTPRCYGDLGTALRDWRPDYAVVANETSAHRASLTALAAAGFAGLVLAEKPLFDKAAELPAHRFRGFFVGYNLRFHPVVERLREALEGERALTASAYVGQYLPDWRPQADYRKTYSARRAEGGGALRDLSHELDYLGWLFGGWRRLAALGGHLSPLEIDSDDAFSILAALPRCPIVSIQVNYLDRHIRREILVHTERHSFRADLVANSLQVDGAVEMIAVGKDDSYRRMHEAALRGDAARLCSADEGLATLGMIEAAERAASGQQWVAQ